MQFLAAFCQAGELQMKFYKDSPRALEAAKYMLAHHPDSGKKVHEYAADMQRRFNVCARYIRDVRTMLMGGCPDELQWELGEGAKSVYGARRDFTNFHQANPSHLEGVAVLYLLTTEAEPLTGKIGTSTDVQTRIHTLELGAGPLVICGCWRFANRRMAGAVERKIIAQFPAADGGRERIEFLDHMDIHKLAVAEGGRWIPTTTIKD